MAKTLTIRIKPVGEAMATSAKRSGPWKRRREARRRRDGGGCPVRREALSARRTEDGAGCSPARCLRLAERR